MASRKRSERGFSIREAVRIITVLVSFLKNGVRMHMDFLFCALVLISFLHAAFLVF